MTTTHSNSVSHPKSSEIARNTIFSISYTSLFVLLLLVLSSVGSTYAVIEKLWQLPVSQLFAGSSQLSLSDMSAQLTIVPTMLVAMLAGGLLGLVSILLQQLVKNTLASDTTLAVGSGAQMTLLIVSLFLPSVGLYGSFWVAFIGAIASMGLVFLLSASSRFNPLVLVLSGLIVNILLLAISSLLMIFYVEQTVSVMAWGGGIVTQNNWHTSELLMLATIVMAVLLIPLLKPLTIMNLDDRQASSLGVPVNLIRGMVVLLVAVVTAMVVSEIGMLSFVGLGAATLVNALNIRRLGMRLIASFLMGGLLLLLASNAATYLAEFSPIMIPAGALTGIFGAPLVIWLILQQRKQHSEDVTPVMEVTRREISTKKWIMWCIGLFMLIVIVTLFVQSVSNIGTDLKVGWQLSTDWALMSEFRLPRTLSAGATGVMLAIAGVLIQTLTRNPMASPEVLGISSGAALGVLVSFMVLPMLGVTAGFGGMLVGGLVGAFMVLVLILWLARSINPAYLLLVGIAISALMTSIMSVLKLTGDPRLSAILSWLSGTSYHSNPETVWWLLGIMIVLFIVSMLLIRPLMIMSLGTSVAKNLGVNVRKVQVTILLVVSLLSATATLAVGPLSFIGLMTPHLATSMGAVELKNKLPLSALLGAGIMILADWLGRYVIFPYEIPAGTIASIIGGGYFVWLMRKMKV